MPLQIGGSKLRSSLNSLKTDFTLENYYFPVIIIDMYHKKKTCWTNITYIMGPSFSSIRILIYKIPRLPKTIFNQIHRMIENKKIFHDLKDL